VTKTTLIALLAIMAMLRCALLALVATLLDASELSAKDVHSDATAQDAEEDTLEDLRAMLQHHKERGKSDSHPSVVDLQAQIEVMELAAVPEKHAAAPGLVQKQVIWELSKGNNKFLTHTDEHELKFNQGTLVDKLIENPVTPVQMKAIVLADARFHAPLDKVFNTAPGELQVVRVSGYVCGKNDPFDGTIGSLEFAFNHSAPPLFIVLGNSRNFVVESAVRLALMNSSRTIPMPPAPKIEIAWSEEDMDIVQEVMPAAKDAILQDPQASFHELTDTAGKLNVWNSIETLLTTSVSLYDGVKSGKLQVHGAFFNVDTSKVHFMGEHPALKALMSERPSEDIVRTAKAHSVPAEEAYAVLYAGNQRYSKGNGGGFSYSSERHTQLSADGQNPMAIILGCADSRAPPETFFDSRPGDLFILRTAGNTCSNGPSSILGSAEYAIANLHTKLVVVMGHTKCGAVTAAVSTARNNQSMTSLPGSIGKVLATMKREAAQAIAELPEEEIVKQVIRATDLNVFATMEKLIKHSKIVRGGVRTMDVQVHGAVYDIESGEVRWLGQHPEVERIIARPLPVHNWKVGSYMRPAFELTKSMAAAEITSLLDGNKRFVKGNSDVSKNNSLIDASHKNPSAIVLGGTEMRVPIETVFDSEPGDIVVQRSMGIIAGHPSDSLYGSLEYAVLRFAPKLLVVLAETDSPVITAALDYVYGQPASFGLTHTVMDRVAVSALQAVQQVDDDSRFSSATKARTTAGRGQQVRKLTVELNALYTVEQLLRHSRIIRSAVIAEQMEIHVAVLHEHTGEVEFVGMHPMQSELLADVTISEEDEPETQKTNVTDCELDIEHNHEHDEHHEHDHDHSKCTHVH